MVWILVAEVIVPLQIDQTYVVAPSGPAAELLLSFPTRRSSDLMDGVAGLALIVTLAVLLAEQPAAFVTTSVRPTVPEASAEQAMEWKSVAEVIVPLVIDQKYVVAPAGPAAELPVELAQVLAGVVMDGVAGLALIVTLAVLLAEQRSEERRVGIEWRVRGAPGV